MTPEATPEDDTDELTPAQVADQARSLLPDDGTVEEAVGVETPFTALLTPESRFRIIAALTEADGEPMAVSRLVEIAGVSKASFHRHEDDLLGLGVMQEVDKVGNARRFALDKQHPAAQLLWMLDRVLSFGETSMALDEAFVLD